MSILVTLSWQDQKHQNPLIDVSVLQSVTEMEKHLLGECERVAKGSPLESM